MDNDDEYERFPPLPNPRFDLVRIGSPEGTPEGVARTFAEVGVPIGLIGYEYRALPESVHLEGPLRGRLIAFGADGVFARVCIDLTTGEIVHVPKVESATASGVNRDLETFTRCVAAVINRLPFYEEDADDEEFARVADEIGDIIRDLDDDRYADDGFWGGFREDVAQGHYCDWDESE